MKIFLVLEAHYDREGTRYLEVRQVFSTRELAEEYARFELDELEVQEHLINTETTEYTKRVKDQVEDGSLEIREDSRGKSFIYT